MILVDIEIYMYFLRYWFVIFMVFKNFILFMFEKLNLLIKLKVYMLFVELN